MNAEESNEEVILEQALTIASKTEREAFTRDACGGDDQLHARVESLIEAHEAAGGFLAEKTARATADGRHQSSPVATAGGVIGRYKLLENVGEGGWGVLYVA